MINVARGDRNAIWLPRCRDALMASRRGKERGGRRSGDGDVINGARMAVRTLGKTKTERERGGGGQR